MEIAAVDELSLSVRLLFGSLSKDQWPITDLHILPENPETEFSEPTFVGATLRLRLYACPQ